MLIFKALREIHAELLILLFSQKKKNYFGELFDQLPFHETNTLSNISTDFSIHIRGRKTKLNSVGKEHSCHRSSIQSRLSVVLHDSAPSSCSQEEGMGATLIPHGKSCLTIHFHRNHGSALHCTTALLPQVLMKRGQEQH